MWIKNATVYGINPKFVMPLPIPETLAFTPITDYQDISVGWAPVLEGALCFAIPDQTLLYFMIEKKSVPKSAVNEIVLQKAAAFEKMQGFGPGKKTLKEMRERTVDELLPRAIPTRSKVAVWIDRKNHRLVIDSTSNTVLDLVQKQLIATFPEIGLQDVSWPRAKVITEWLFSDRLNFTLDDEIAIAYPGEHGKTVKFKSTDVHGYDVTEHIQKHGASVETVAMTFDSKLSFVMTENCQIRRIRPLDILRDAAAEKGVDQFANDFTLMTLELSDLITALIGEA